MEDVGQRWGKKGVEEGNTLSRFKQLSGEERTDCSTWRPDQWHQGHRVTATSHSSLRSSPILSPFPSPSFLLSSPPQLLHTLKQHMVVHWVLSQSSQGSTLLDLMQQIKLWHLLVLLTKTAQSVALLGTLFSLDHQLLNSSLFALNYSIGHLFQKFNLFHFTVVRSQNLPKNELPSHTMNTLHLSRHSSLIWDMSRSSLKPL